MVERSLSCSLMGFDKETSKMLRLSHLGHQARFWQLVIPKISRKIVNFLLNLALLKTTFSSNAQDEVLVFPLHYIFKYLSNMISYSPLPYSFSSFFSFLALPAMHMSSHCWDRSNPMHSYMQRPNKAPVEMLKCIARKSMHSPQLTVSAENEKVVIVNVSPNFLDW